MVNFLCYEAAVVITNYRISKQRSSMFFKFVNNYV